MRRDWTAANVKRGPCRVCGATFGIELAHVTGRAYDRAGFTSRVVKPDSVVPLCAEHHRAYDAHTLDLLPYLTREEEVQAVADLGLENARIRTCPSAYSKVAA